MKAQVFVVQQAQAQIACLREDLALKALDRIARINTVESFLEHSKPIGDSPLGEVRRFRAGKFVRILAAVDQDMVTVVGIGLRPTT
jgi:hypothetical protein